MANYKQRCQAIEDLFTERAYASDSDVAIADVARSILAEPFHWETIEELVADAESLAESGLSDGESADEQIAALIAGRGSSIVHNIISGRHQLIVDGVVGSWYAGRQPAWCGNVCAMIDENGDPRIFRAFPLDRAEIRRVES